MANRDLAELNLEWTEVRAPIAGLLSRRMVDPGNLIKADDTVLTSIVSLDPLYVYFDVHEQAMLRIKRLMQQGKLKLQAQGEKAVPVQIGLSDEADFPHKGVVDFTDNRVDLNTGTLAVPGQDRQPRRRPRQPLHRAGPVRAGAAADRRAPPRADGPRAGAGDRPGPQDGLRRQGEEGRGGQAGQGRRRASPSTSPMVRDVGTVGVLRDGYREVEKGIEPGDWVVVAGMQRLRPGIEVKAEKYDEQPAPKAAPTKAKPPATRPPGTPRRTKDAARPDGPEPGCAKRSARGGPGPDRRRHRREAGPHRRSWRTASPPRPARGQDAPSKDASGPDRPLSSDRDGR